MTSPSTVTMLCNAFDAYIAEHEAALANGQLDALPDLAPLAELIAQGLQQLTPQTSLQEAERLQMLPQRMQSLIEAMTLCQRDMRAEMDQLGVAQRAAHAYRAVKG